MPLEPAPYFDAVPDEPVAQCYWLHASDEVRIRLGYWALQQAKGTVFLFPGRSEYIEKYAITAADFAEHGLATIAVDWRGQGLADRLLEDDILGHVPNFDDYQKDVLAVLEAADTVNLPKPWYLLGHSMGGCIGLRALMNKLPVAAAGFSGPMWGIDFTPGLRGVAHVLGNLAVTFGFGEKLAPGTQRAAYVLHQPFEDNKLTISPEMYERLQVQARANPELTLGGPTIQWVTRALEECRALAALPSPVMPCLTVLGSNERIVNLDAINARMADWTDSKMFTIEQGEHEGLMENSDRRGPAINALAEHFLAHSD